MFAWQSEIVDGLFSTSQQVVFENSYMTRVGQQSTFYLQDKTKVVLNTNSRLTVTYTDKQRAFELAKGEMHITVAHNSKQPLSVYAGNKVIQAVGTAFNVQLHDEEVELIVTDGKVLVAPQDSGISDPVMLTEVFLPISSMAVSEGETVQLGGEQEQVKALTAVDLQAALSWQQGNLIFRGEPLETAMAEVSRYSGFGFEIADEQLKKVQIAGLFKTDDVNGLLRALKQNFNIDFQRRDRNTVVLSRIDKAQENASLEPRDH